MPRQVLPELMMSQENGGLEPNREVETTNAIVNNRKLGVMASMLRALPTLFVLAALGGLAAYGHFNGWRIPKTSSLFSDVDAEAEWCEEHGVPEENCIECIPSILPPEQDHGWCKLHGVHQCPHCNPQVAQLKEAPEPQEAKIQYISVALGTKERQENNLGCNLYQSRVQFSSIDAVRKAGIEVELAVTQPIIESVSANGELTYDATRVAHVSTRASGNVFLVERKVGDLVNQGDLLAIVDSSDVGDAKSSLLDALAQADYQAKTVARLSPLAKSQAVSGARLLEEESLLEQARIQVNRSTQALENLGISVELSRLQTMQENERWDAVRFLGVPKGIQNSLAKQTASNNLIPVYAPIAGVVTERHIVQGEVVSSSDTLFEVVDTSVLWLRMRVALEDAKHLQLGQPVKFRPDGSKDRIDSSIDWISTNVDSSTRTVEIRCEVPNRSQNLRNQTFGKGDIVLRQAEDAVVVPSEAVQWDGSCFVVFVRDKDYFTDGHPKLFHPRSVRPGVVSDGDTEVIAGLLPGEVVVTKGSSVLRSQILKNNLGAGCTCGH